MKKINQGSERLIHWKLKDNAREIKEEREKWKDIPHALTEIIMLNCPYYQETNRFSAISIKLSMTLLIEIEEKL